MSMVGSKTPVSIINEYFIAIGITPSYELIVSQQATNTPFFVYRLTAGEYFANGEGSSKQQAKHNAAQLLIDIIKNQEEPTSQLASAIKTLSIPQDNLIAFNAVGNLTDYCILKNYPAAVYDVVRDEGPAHARIFTYKCDVSNLTELGTARTKKQAKHQAAYAMLVRLKNLCGEEVNAVVKVNVEQSQQKKTDFSQKDDDATKKYIMLNKSSRTANNSAYIADQYRCYVSLLEKSPTLATLASAGIPESGYFELLKTIADELGLKLECKEMNNAKLPITFVKLPLSPCLVRGAGNVADACQLALKAILSLL